MFSSPLLLGCLACLASISQCFEGRIVNGEEVQLGEIPYQIALFVSRSNFNFCGGSLIHPFYIVTAAHCLENLRPTDIHVVAGTINLDKLKYIRTIKEIIIHEEFNTSKSWSNDIALIRLSMPLISSTVTGIGYVLLPKQNETVEEGHIAIVSGFGTLYENGPVSRYLLRASISIASQEYCKIIYSNILHNIYDSQICAYNAEKRRGACNGDSGGPLVINGKLIGIVSWSLGCARTDFPTVFTRVSSYINWIEERIKSF